MDKKFIYIVLVVLVIGVLLIANISGSSKNLNPEKVSDLFDEMEEIDSNEEIKYDDSLIYGVNETYLDQNFSITLTNVEYEDNLYKYSFMIENTTGNTLTLTQNMLVCEINQQAVDNNSDIAIELNKGEKEEIFLECYGTNEDNVNILYHGKLFDGRDIDIRFKKK